MVSWPCSTRREQGIFFDDHLLWASCVPLSHLELLIVDLVPNRATPVVICDGEGADDGPAEQAARRMAELGWTDVTVLEGGMAGWPYERYSGVNVPSKAFGEWVEGHFGTPHLTPEELRDRLDRGDPLVILDSRPMREFRRMSIPGATCCPGAELVYRVHDLVTDPTTTVVVNCAGRTRSIIGAQSLRNAGLPNPVYALEGGTMGWELAGFDVARERDEEAPPPTPAGLRRARRSAQKVAGYLWARPGPVAGRGGLGGGPAPHHPAPRRADRRRVRRRAPAGQPSRAGRSACPGGRRVRGRARVPARAGGRGLGRARHDDRVVAAPIGCVRGLRARRGVRPRAAPARWRPGPAPDGDRRRAGPHGGRPRVAGPRDGRRPGRQPALPDGATSPAPGGRCAPVSPRAAAAIGPTTDVVLTSPDGRLAALAVPQARRAWPDARVAVLAGGSRAWTGPLGTGAARLTTATNDVWYKPYDAEDQAVARQHMADYLTWEVALVEQIAVDDTVHFGTPFSAPGLRGVRAAVARPTDRS